MQCNHAAGRFGERVLFGFSILSFDLNLSQPNVAMPVLFVFTDLLLQIALAAVGFAATITSILLVRQLYRYQVQGLEALLNTNYDFDLKAKIIHLDSGDAILEIEARFKNLSSIRVYALACFVEFNRFDGTPIQAPKELVGSLTNAVNVAYHEHSITYVTPQETEYLFRRERISSQFIGIEPIIQCRGFIVAALPDLIQIKSVPRYKIGKRRLEWIAYMQRWKDSTIRFISWAESTKTIEGKLFHRGQSVLLDGNGNVDDGNSHLFHEILKGTSFTTRELLIDLRNSTEA